jgi:hypothetical protein
MPTCDRTQMCARAHARSTERCALPRRGCEGPERRVGCATCDGLIGFASAIVLAAGVGVGPATPAQANHYHVIGVNPGFVHGDSTFHSRFELGCGNPR